MQIILLEKVENLGQMGDQVNVKAGYARNFLVPAGKALPATADNIADFESRRAELEQRAADLLTRATGRGRAVEAIGSVTIAANAGPGGKLYGSVGPAEIAAAVTEAGTEVEKSEVRMDDVIRVIGEYEVSIHLHSDVDIALQVNVIEEGGANAPILDDDEDEGAEDAADEAAA